MTENYTEENQTAWGNLSVTHTKSRPTTKDQVVLDMYQELSTQLLCKQEQMSELANEIAFIKKLMSRAEANHPIIPTLMATAKSAENNTRIRNSKELQYKCKPLIIEYINKRNAENNPITSSRDFYDYLRYEKQINLTFNQVYQCFRYAEVGFDSDTKTWQQFKDISSKSETETPAE